MIGDFPLTEWFFYLVRWLYDVLGNSYFLTIVVITFALRLVQIFPDIKNRKSQRKQAAIQPEIEKLQKRYADNPQKLQQEQAKLMKANGIGIMSSCLPMLLTLPIFFCFLAAFRFWGYEQTIKLTYETIIDQQSQDTQSQETFDSYKFLWITNIWQPDSGFAPVVPTAKNVKSYSKIENLVIFHKGYTNMRGEHVDGEDIWQVFCDNGIASGDYKTDAMSLLPSDDAQNKYNTLMEKYQTGYNNGWFVLPFLAAGLQLLSAWMSQRQSRKLNPNAQQKGMGFMMWLFPVMSIFICMTATSAFSLYWVISSLFQIASSLIMAKLMPAVPSNPKEIIAK